MKKTIRTWVLASAVLLASGFVIRATLMTNFKRSVALVPEASPIQTPANYRVAPPLNATDSMDQPSPEESVLPN